MNKLLIEGLKSNIITQKDNIITAIKTSLHTRELRENDIIIVSSKVVAITENRVVKISNDDDFLDIVKKESDKYFNQKGVILSLKNNIFTPWAGVDKSNIDEGHAVLWPKKPFLNAKFIREKLKKVYNVNNLGIIISDSFCVPLRVGVTAVAIGFAGFDGVKNLVGKKDIFGNVFKYSKQAIADELAAAGQLVMGEGAEQVPFALIRGAKVVFTDSDIDENELVMDKNECLFNPLYKNV